MTTSLGRSALRSLGISMALAAYAACAGPGCAGPGGAADDAGGDPGAPAPGLWFGAYKDTSIHLNWNTFAVSTMMPGSAVELAGDLAAQGSGTVTLAFATGECGSETWGGVSGATLAAANVPLLTAARIRYVLSTGGAAGSFTCGSDAGFEAFLARWSSPQLIGVDLDIEAGQSAAAITELLRRVQAAHAAHPALRFSLTLATLANNRGASVAEPLGAAAPEGLNGQGAQVLAAVSSVLGFRGTEATWPSYLTVNLMTMDYGAPGPGVCVVRDGSCQMGESALQAAYNLRDRHGVPWSNIEVTPMIGGNDVVGERFTLADVDTVARFAIARGLAGVHYWSYDRDNDCAQTAASPTCNSLGDAGRYGFLRRFLAGGLR